MTNIRGQQRVILARAFCSDFDAGYTASSEVTGMVTKSISPG
jgi:hypothetical protein